MESSNLHILTYNIHKGFSSGNLRFELHRMREELHNADVDMVFLQEIQGQHLSRSNRIKGWPTHSQFEFLADRLWPHYAYGKNAIYTNGHHGNAILSKYPFIRWRNVNVSSMRSASRSVLHGVICPVDTYQTVHVICIHLDVLAHERKRQLNILNEYIKHQIPAHEPLVIAGDFNDWRSHAERHLAEHLGLKEIFQYTHGRYAKTFPAWMPVLPLDRIYFRGLEPLDCRCYNHAPWHRLSDHAPLYAAFALNE